MNSEGIDPVSPSYRQSGGSWIERAKRNLLPLSRSQIFQAALREWTYAPPPIDHEVAEELCELCNHTHLRWHHAIENQLTKSRLNVGSQCILRFDEIVVQDEQGIPLTTKAERKSKLNNDLAKHRQEQMLNSLRELYRRLKNPDEKAQLESLVARFKEKGGFSVRELLWLFRRLEGFNLKHDKSLFKVRLRKDADKAKLIELSDSEFKLVANCLSSDQLMKFGRQLER